MNSFIFYDWYKSAIDKLKEPDKRLAAYEMICNYALKGVAPDETTSYEEILMLFETVKGSIDTNRAGRNSKDYRKFRKRVLKRDEYTCQNCGCKRNLQVHHILPYAFYPSERINLSNGITLCKKCHYKEHYE